MCIIIFSSSTVLIIYIGMQVENSSKYLLEYIITTQTYIPLVQNTLPCFRSNFLVFRLFSTVSSLLYNPTIICCVSSCPGPPDEPGERPQAVLCSHQAPRHLRALLRRQLQCHPQEVQEHGGPGVWLPLTPLPPTPDPLTKPGVFSANSFPGCTSRNILIGRQSDVQELLFYSEVQTLRLEMQVFSDII